MVILIADDQQHKIDLIRSMLVHLTCDTEPLIAMTTEDAMRLIDTHDITHAFVDYYIPTKNGPAIISYLKAKNPAAHIALVSSSDNPRRNAEAKNAGAEACICTSDEMDTVEQAFRDLLENWASVSP